MYESKYQTYACVETIRVLDRGQMRKLDLIYTPNAHATTTTSYLSQDIINISRYT